MWPINPYQSTQGLILPLGRVKNAYEGPLWRDILAGREDIASSSTYEVVDVEIITCYDICLAI